MLMYDRHTDPLWPIIRWMIFVVVTMAVSIMASIGFLIFR